MKQRTFWKQYAPDLYKLEKKRQWEEDETTVVMQIVEDLFIGIALGIVGLVAIVFVLYLS